MFELNEKQKLKFEKWKKTLPPEPPTAIGGAFTYMFTPNSLGIIVRIQYWNGQEINLTNYDSW